MLAVPRAEVPNSTAEAAQEVIVWQDITIVADEVTAVDLHCLPITLEPVEVAINGAEAHVREPVADDGVKLVTSRMRLEFLQFFENNFTLFTSSRPGALVIADHACQTP